MTDNLGLGRIAAGMSLDAVGTKANDMVGGLDAAKTEDLVVVFDSTAETLTAAQFISNFLFFAEVGSPAPGGACTLNVPNVNAEAATLKRGAFTVVNNTGQDLTVQVSGQSETPPTLSAGQASILVMEGTHVRLAVPQGAIGGDGADGTDPGVLFTWDTGTTDADPGPGNIRGNNASLASATALYIDDADRSGNNVEAHLLTWDDATNTPKGHLYLTRTSDGAQTIFTVGAVTDSSGYIGLAVTYVSGATSFTAADAISAQFYRAGDAGATGTSGASAMTIVRVVATANVAIATALENGDAIDSVTLATNDLVLLTAQTAPAENGVYVVPASGAATRHTSFDAYDELPGAYFSVMEGTASADTLWRCTSDRGGTIDVTALVISEFSGGGGSAFSGAMVTKAVTQTGGNYTSATAIAWDAEVYDEGGWHDNVTDNTKLTVPSGVTRIRLSGQVSVNNDTADRWSLVYVTKNGSASWAGRPYQVSEKGGAGYGINFATAALTVSAGDFFELLFQTENDTSIDVEANVSWFAIEKVS